MWIRFLRRIYIYIYIHTTPIIYYNYYIVLCVVYNTSCTPFFAGKSVN